MVVTFAWMAVVNKLSRNASSAQSNAGSFMSADGSGKPASTAGSSTTFSCLASRASIVHPSAGFVIVVHEQERFTDLCAQDRVQFNARPRLFCAPTSNTVSAIARFVELVGKAHKIQLEGVRLTERRGELDATIVPAAYRDFRLCGRAARTQTNRPPPARPRRAGGCCGTGFRDRVASTSRRTAWFWRARAPAAADATAGRRPL